MRWNKQTLSKKPKTDLFVFLGLLIVTLFLAQEYIADFFTWDDPRFIYEAERVLKGQTSLFAPVTGGLFPSLLAHLACIRFFSENNPVGYHLVNFILHTLNGFFLFTICRRLTRNFLFSLLAGLIFVATANHAEILYNITNACHLGSVTFSLIFLLAFDHFLVCSERNRLYYGGAFLSLCIAFGYKATAVIALLFLPALLIYRGKKQIHSWIGLIPFYLIALAFILAHQLHVDLYQGPGYFKQGASDILPHLSRYLASVIYILAPYHSVLGLAKQTMVIGFLSGLIFLSFLGFRSKNQKVKWLIASVIFTYVVLLPTWGVPFDGPYARHILPPRLRYYGNLAGAGFKAGVFLLLWDCLRMACKRQQMAAILTGILLFGFLTHEYVEFSSRMNSLRKGHEVLLTEKLILDLAKNQALVQQARVVALINFPGTMLFTRYHDSSALVRLFTHSQVMAGRAEITFDDPIPHQWVSSTGKSLNTGRPKVTVTSYYGHLNNFFVDPTLEAKPILYAWYNAEEQQIYYRFEDLPRKIH